MWLILGVILINVLIALFKNGQSLVDLLKKKAKKATNAIEIDEVPRNPELYETHELTSAVEIVFQGSQPKNTVEVVFGQLEMAPRPQSWTTRH